MKSSIDSFLDKFIHVKTGRQKKDTFESAHAKVLHHLHTINFQSIDAVLRDLDRKAEEEQREIERTEKAMADYKGQLNRPFEHDEKLKDLVAKQKQAQLNALLDLDKHDTQTAAEEGEKAVPASFAAKVMAENQASEMAP